jgi:YD repeat-containing protein
MTSLGERQASLVAALVAGADIPAGFDGARVASTRRALLRKRAGEVAGAWPLLAAGVGPRWAETFAAWAAGRPPRGSLRDGWDLARELAAGPGLAGPAAEELAAREVAWRYDGQGHPRRRRLPAARRTPGAVVVQVLGTVRVLRR